MNKICCIDPGNLSSGYVEIENGEILYADNLLNEVMVSRIISHYEEMLVLYEDMKPFSVRLSQQMIDACKFIGELEYRLKSARIHLRAIGRWEVKQWVFNTYPKLCQTRIQKKISDIGKRAVTDQEKLSASKRKQHFVYVDDRIVIAAMKEYWDIATPKPGKKSQYGLSKHSWQALSLYAVYSASK